MDSSNLQNLDNYLSPHLTAGPQPIDFKDYLRAINGMSNDVLLNDSVARALADYFFVRDTTALFIERTLRQFGVSR